MKKELFFTRNIYLLVILSLSIHCAQGIADVCSFIAVEACKYASTAIPGLTYAIVQNIANMRLNITPSLNIPTIESEALKDTNSTVLSTQQTVPSIASNFSARTTAQQSLKLCDTYRKAAQETFSRTATIEAPTKSITLDVLGPVGKSSFNTLRADFVQHASHIPKAYEYVELNVTVDGKALIHNLGTSPVSLSVGIQTQDAPLSATDAAADHDAYVLQMKHAREIVYNGKDAIGAIIPHARPFTSAIKPLLQKVEHTLINTINHNPNMAQTCDTLIELKTIENNCLEQMSKIEHLYTTGWLPVTESQGLYSWFDEIRQTARNMQGAFCDKHGNIVGISTHDRQQQLGRILNNHCKRIDYGDALRAQKLSQVTNIHAASAKGARVKASCLKTTPFNEDLRLVINNMRIGAPDHAQAIIGKYDPTKFWFGDNWWNNRYELHDTMQRAYRECLEEWYTPDGILKAYETHPLWPELQEALQQHPELKAQILDKLRNESAFCTQQLQRIGLHNPTEPQIQQMYKLLQYADLQSFDQYIRNMRTPADLTQALKSCRQDKITDNYLRKLDLPDPIIKYLMNKSALVQSVMFDPHFKAMIQKVGTNPEGLTECFKFLTERRSAISALINRLEINNPTTLTATLCYNLLDNYHDASRMLDILLELDPYHVDPLVRQTYADFFDARGLQKVLPINDQIYLLWQERMGTAVDVASNSTLRDAYNRLTAIQTNSLAELHIVGRGLTYLELGQTQHPTAPFMREYAEQYIKALTNPSGEHGNTLAVADIVDAFSQPEARSLAHVGLNRLSEILNSTAPSSPDNQQLLSDLRSVAEHIRNNNIRKAQRHLYTLPLKPAASAATSSSHIATEAQHVTQDTSLHSTTGATSSRPIEVCPSQLTDFAHAVACAQKHIQGITTLLTLADGILVAVNHNTAAFASFDGYVDMLHHRNSFAKCFTQDMRRVAQYAGPHALNRSRILEHAERNGFDISGCCPGNSEIVPISSGGCIGPAYPEMPPDGCGLDTYNAGESNKELSDCGTGSIDLRGKPYVGAPNPVYEQLEKARIEREQEASRVLRRIRDRSTTVKHATAACNPIRRSHPTSEIKYPATQQLVRAFDADADSGQRASSSAAGLVAGLQHILVDNKIDITKIDLDNLPQHLYDEAICSGDKLQQWVKQFKSTPGALGKDGPLQKLLEMGYVGASPGCQSAARGALYELKAARELENKGEYIISFGSKNIKNCPRDIDIITTSKFIECKDINWNSLNSSRVNKIMSDLPQFKKIATEHGKIFEFHSKQPIPKPIADWLIDKNINFIEG